MKTLLLLIFTTIFYAGYSQCDIKTNNRPDGSTIKYFTPKPVAKTKSHEAGMSLYYNETTKEYTLSVFLLYKSGAPKELNGNLLIQTTSNNGLSLKPYTNKLITMNGNEVATSIYLLTQKDIDQLKKYPLKTISVNYGDSMIGLTTTENKSLIINEFLCLN